ncbi:MAG: hypothetical protein HYV02_03835 [Deltaproteobacteria bacterium]|nr:hypothetical protein [Deltaproteobacteria bacterium]
MGPHSGEKGPVEKTIGLVRRWLPKPTDFATGPHRQVQAIERWLHHRPRKYLHDKTPAALFRAAVALTG